MREAAGEGMNQVNALALARKAGVKIDATMVGKTISHHPDKSTRTDGDKIES